MALCDTHAGVRVVEGWAEVCRASDEARGSLVVGALRAAGLDAELLSQKDHAQVVGFGALALVRVLVPAYQFGPAREVLAEGGPFHGLGIVG